MMPVSVSKMPVSLGTRPKTALKRCPALCVGAAVDRAHARQDGIIQVKGVEGGVLIYKVLNDGPQNGVAALNAADLPMGLGGAVVDTDAVLGEPGIEVTHVCSIRVGSNRYW